MDKKWNDPRDNFEKWKKEARDQTYKRRRCEMKEAKGVENRKESVLFFSNFHITKKLYLWPVHRLPCFLSHFHVLSLSFLLL